MKIKFTKPKIFALILALVLLTLAACSNNASSSSSATSSSQSETIPSSSSNNVSSSTPSSAASSSGTSSSEAPPSSSSQSEASQQSSMSTQEQSTISSKTTDLADFVKNEEYGLYSKIVSCSIENDVMTVIFSAYAENTVNADVSMDVWMSSDNGAGEVYETYSIDKLKEYSISMSSFWFEQTETYKGMSYEVIVTIATTRHIFYFRDGKMWS